MLKSKRIPNILFFFIILFAFIGILADAIYYYRISVAFIVLYCIAKGTIHEKYFLNPYILFSLTPISLLIYVNVGSEFMVDLSSSTWLLGIINMVAFLLAMNYTSDCRHKSSDNYIPKREHGYYTVIALVLIGTIPSYLYIFTGVVVPLAYIIGLFSVIGIVKALASKKKTPIVIAISLFLLPMLVGHTSKTGVLTLSLAIILCYEKYFMKTLKQRRNLIIICCIGVVAMINAFTYANKDRGSYDVDDNYSYYAKRVEWNYSTSLFMPYMYFCTPWTNLQYVTETQNNYTGGLWSIKPVLGYLQLEDSFKNEYKMASYSSFNTFTFIGVEYKDFGFWGSCLASIFLGFFVKKVYSRYRISRSPLDCACYLYTAQAVLEMFFSNHFFGQSYPFTIVILIWLYRRLFSRRPALSTVH